MGHFQSFHSVKTAITGIQSFSFLFPTLFKIPEQKELTFILHLATFISKNVTFLLIKF